MSRYLLALLATVCLGFPCRADEPARDLAAIVATAPAEYRGELSAQLERAGGNRTELVRAMSACKPEQRESMAFLLANMPERDLTSLKADFLLKNVDLAYEARQRSAWAATVPVEVFLNDVLPYANVNERRDDWRPDFVARFAPLVKDCKTSTEAAQILNGEVFKALKVQYHASKRRKADQSPYESTEVGYASCTGLSIILADACRAVGVPARVVGTPQWSDNSGNHTWVEFWDGQWWFIGAAEPGPVNSTWFGPKAAKADPSKPDYRIYAASFKKTPEPFVMTWAPSRTDVSAVDVSRYYIKRGKLAVRVVGEDGKPAQATIRIVQKPWTIGQIAGATVSFEVAADAEYVVRAAAGELTAEQTVRISAESDAAIALKLTKAPANVPPSATSTAPAIESKTLDALKGWLSTRRADRAPLKGQPFAQAALTKGEAAEAKRLLWEDHAAVIRATRESEWKDDKVVAAGKTMRFLRKNFGTRPDAGWNLYISMHGGGGAPAKVNDQQWQNQIKLYQPADSLYICPRAPTDNWNLWHEAHIDALFDQLIREAIVLEGVNPDRVYIMGYSAGGDGVYQLAPRMADRLAAAAMMAGHPNDASPLGLRNIGFTIHVGAKDDGYHRNEVAAKWGILLDDLHKADPAGYAHEVQLHEGRSHWMNLEDKVALGWMAGFTRNPLPDRVVWKQAGVTHDRFYWLAVPAEQAKAGQEIIAQRTGQTIEIIKADGVGELAVLMNDDMLDLDRPVSVTMNGKELAAGPVPRTIEVIAETMAERGDLRSVFSGRRIVRTGAAP